MVIHPRSILWILGLLLTFFSLSLLLPIVTAMHYGEDTLPHFLTTMGVGLGLGLGLVVFFRRSAGGLALRDGFLITVLTWVLLSAYAAFAFKGILHISWVDAFFEATSGLTTTGATVLTQLDAMPRSLLIYRQLLQWLGGMGLIVLAVAVLPLLDVGGMQLYRAEMPGPTKDSRLAPRMRTTAVMLYGIYAALTLACALGYWLAGMGRFDALAHALSTVSIGGFSTYDDSIGHFDNPLVELVAVVFMVLGASNFALHFAAWKSLSLRGYLRDEEFRFYLLTLLIVSLLLGLSLLYSVGWDEPGRLARTALFQGISHATTTGFSNTSLQFMAPVPLVILLLAPFAGGCAGSVGGGLKMLRVVLLVRQSMRELFRLVHPTAVYHVKINGIKVDTRVQEAIWGFASAYFIVYGLGVLAVSATGLDFHTAASATAACLNNLGPGQGLVYSNYASIPDAAKAILTFVMIAGRLEVMTVLVLFTAVFWRQ